MKSLTHILATSTLLLAGTLSLTSAQQIYNGGDYAGAGLQSLQLIANLSQAIVTHSPSHDIFNTSSIIIEELKQLSQKLDILGAGGFAYAFQDKIPELYNQDEFVYTTANHISQIQDEYNGLINLYLTRKNKIACANLYA